MSTETEISPDDTVNAAAFASLIVGLVSAGLALWPILSPPFTDAELENVVDTWEPTVFVGLMLIAAFAFAALVSALAAWICSRLPRRIFGAAAGAFIVAILLQVFSLNMLTARAEKAAGHALKWSPLG